MWVLVTPVWWSENPPARELASYFIDNGRLLLFGGLGLNPQTGKVESSLELWEFSFFDFSWKRLGKDSMAKPDPVYGASISLITNYLYTVGGEMKSGDFSETCFVFDFAMDGWIKNVECAGTFRSSTLAMDMVDLDLIEHRNSMGIISKNDIIFENDNISATLLRNESKNANDASIIPEVSQITNVSLSIRNDNKTLLPTLVVVGGNVGSRVLTGYELIQDIRRDDKLKETGKNNNSKMKTSFRIT
ncbi:uncharacterized protein MONOS_3639 [Monocercomonoides exilis]|uniref:uncharacterized protein n=1 Tax=Monocercomonoides exilis TaxID=2049356 RepID=UPI0035596428|nr:hypothetical protein MONOS_3639 [Monocercomonoides exilis]|eukprot:MONOS_3639.1-p1 / transcript=MONOS_3639.1 / gene=MONOS_3639 / organism=Monocercomonoides_exilis_PA203 / gene_product=unspecified product / transcript_product=unspecified product / location=Mono_scaffold00087:79216-79953(+) / protein_length=246 / sequence_SO=supercontig / SO=protein_coding / is_pseudo=false